MRNTLLLIVAFFILSTQTQAQLKSISFAELQAAFYQDNDTLYVFNFWATWCAPCVAELPHFQRLSYELREEKVKFVFVSLDFENDYETRLREFVEKKMPEAEVWLLADAYKKTAKGWIGKVSPSWQGAIPATLVTCTSKNVYSFKEEEFGYIALRKWLTSF